MTTAARRRPEPSHRAQRVLTIIFAVAIVGIVVALILADRRSPMSSPPEQPTHQNP